MKLEIVIAVDPNDAGDMADVGKLAAAHGRAYNRIELPNPFGHFRKSLGQPITADQLSRATYCLREARHVYQRYADRTESSHFVPIDEAKAIVAAIDEAAEVVERWTMLIPGSDRDALAEDFAAFYDENAGGDVMEDELVKYRAADWLRAKVGL